MLLQKIPGDITVGIDGVTVLKESKLLYTVSKGNVSMFECMQDLASFSHGECIICSFFCGC